MTSIITFDPPLGAVEHIHGGSQSHIQLLQGPSSIDFLFTARLSAYDYENLVVRDGARLQIWTDIPCLGDEVGNQQAWREIEFVDPEALNREMSAYRKVSLQVSNDPERPQRTEKSILDTHTLYLAIAIPSARAREFSFTYRVVYPSGRTTWLGFYERNGSVIVHADQEFSGPFSSRTIDYAEQLSLKGDWSPYSSPPHAGFITNAGHVDGLQIAKVNAMAATRIWALGKDRLLRHASMLVLVPAPRNQSIQEKITHRPSYIFSASPGATLSISSIGGVTASGSGTVQMTIINCLQQHSPGTIIEAALKHSDLTGNWTLFANDIPSQTVVLACIGNRLPIHAVVMSFGTLWSNFAPYPTSVSVETSKLVTLLNNTGVTGNDIKEFAIFPSSRSAMYVFNVEEERAQPGHFVLEVESSHPNFTEAHTFSAAPLYRLHTQKRLGSASRTFGRNWATAILTSYRFVAPLKADHANGNSRSTVPANPETITDARGLLTPPPSPPLPLGYGVAAQNLSSTLFRASRTSSTLGSTAEAFDDTIPVNYAVRRRLVASNAKTKPATTTPRTELKHLDVDAVVRATFQKAPSRRHSHVDKPAEAPYKRAVPKAQRSSCLMWIFRIVFKCLFASVRVFLKVAFNIRIALSWGVGIVIRGPGFAWGLLWGAGARPGRLSTLPSLNSIISMNQFAKGSPHRQRRLPSPERPSSQSGIQISPTRNDSQVNTNPILDSRQHYRDENTYGADLSHPTYRGTEINLDAHQRLKEPVSSRGSENSIYPNEVETSSAIGFSDSEETSVIRAHETTVAGPVIQDSGPIDTASNSIISCSKTPVHQSRPEHCHEYDGGFYAEVTPLCSNEPETVELVLLSMASAEARTSEKDSQPAYDATNAQTSGFSATPFERVVNFFPSRQLHTGTSGPSVALEKDIHAPVNVRPVGVHDMHPSGPLGSITPNVSPSSCPSILDLSTVTDAVIAHKPYNADSPRQETLNTQYAASGFVIRYQLPPEALDHEAGTVVVSVNSPEPLLKQT